MSYDERLAGRMRRALAGIRGMDEKKMFGGVAFLLHGKMCCGIVKTDLMVRVGPEEHENVLKEPHARPMDFAGRPMKGYVYVAPAGCRDARSLKRWLDLGIKFVAGITEQGRERHPARRGAKLAV